MTHAILLDTETSAKKDPEVIELAFIDLNTPQALESERSSFERRYKPSKPISLGALAVHHILDEDLENAPPSAVAAQDIPPETEYFVGHNVDFDWIALGKPEVKRIDTLALARRAWPQLDAHTVGALTYHLNRADARTLLQRAHSALHDVRLTLPILAAAITTLQDAGELSADLTWVELHELSERARIPEKMPFGKHVGQPLKEVPHSYIRWALDNITDMDVYLRKGLDAVLNNKVR